MYNANGQFAPLNRAVFIPLLLPIKSNFIIRDAAEKTNAREYTYFINYKPF